MIMTMMTMMTMMAMMTMMTMMTMMMMMTMMTMMTTLNIRHQRWWLRKNLDLVMKRSTTRNMLSPHFSHKWVINTKRLWEGWCRMERELY